MSSLHLTDAWELLKMTAQVDWVWIYIYVTQKAIFNIFINSLYVRSLELRKPEIFLKSY